MSEQGTDKYGAEYKRTSNDFYFRLLEQDNCVCSICHGTGAKIEFEYVTRNYESARQKGKICKNLQAHRHSFWICQTCIDNLVKKSKGLVKVLVKASPTGAESEEEQSKQTDDSCLDFDFDKVKEILKKDGFGNLIVDHTCEEKQEQTRDEKMIDAIDFAIEAIDSQDNYSMGMRNGMRYVKSLITGKESQYELRWTDEEIKLGINLGDEVVGDYGAKGVVVGIDTHKEAGVMLSLLMGNHKVPQLVQASNYKTKTGRHFPQIIEVLEQMKGEADGK